jgi:hypothetical protein
MRLSKPTQFFILTFLTLIAGFLVHRSNSTSPFLPKFHFTSISRPNLSDFMQQSELLFQRAVAKRREIRHLFGDRGFFPAKDENSFKETPWSIWDLVTPSYGCPWEMERIGRVGEGGWWVCGLSRLASSKGKKQSCVVYSFGECYYDSINFLGEEFHLVVKLRLTWRRSSN